MEVNVCLDQNYYLNFNDIHKSRNTCLIYLLGMRSDCQNENKR